VKPLRWIKLFETQDTIAYEKRKKDLKIRIEARLSERSWEVFKIYNSDKNRNRINLIQEYTTKSLPETKHLIEKLKHEKDLDINKIKEIKKKEHDPLNIEFKREYKEEYVEKWFFSIQQEHQENMLFVRFENTITMDVLLHEKYQFIEQQIIEQIVEQLGLKSINPQMAISVYYYSKHKKRKTKSDDRILLARLEMEMQSDEED